ncbi:MAG: hypothetical protein RL226_2201, partial [Bacteroidota bacterium]
MQKISIVLFLVLSFAGCKEVNVEIPAGETA